MLMQFENFEIIIIALCLAWIIYYSLKIIKSGIQLYIQFIGNKYFGPYFLLRRLKPQYRNVLKEKMPFYNELDDIEKKKFEKRVQRFIDMKVFVPRGKIKEITPEMKALIAGTAVKLTFGFPFVYFSHFWRILIYHDNYYSGITKQFHKGEVNIKGNIILSWNNFTHGHHYRFDGINLGLHEMAHALRIENAIRNDEYNFLDMAALHSFNQFAIREMNNIKNGMNSVFRRYASTNEHEFFSVFIENYFERPGEILEAHPEMYERMRMVLLYDPLTKERLKARIKIKNSFN